MLTKYKIESGYRKTSNLIWWIHRFWPNQRILWKDNDFTI